MNQDLINLVLIFSIYSMCGWVLESVFKTAAAKKIVNSGFLTGPFCPIYGFGALLVIQSVSLAGNILPQAGPIYQIVLSVLLAIILTSILEYLTGMVMETLFDSKWWDYSEEKFNIHGRVCLKYSVFWGILAYMMLSLVHPYIISIVHTLPLRFGALSAYIVIAYFAVDMVHSINEAYDLREHLAIYGSQFSLEKLLAKHKRLLSAFPHIRVNIKNKQLKEIKASINKKWEQLHNAM